MPPIIWKTLLYASFAYIFALVLVRLVGRKTMSQMTLFDFVMGVSLGTIAATIGLGPSRIQAVITLIVFVIITILVDYLHITSAPLRKMMDSEPVTVIKNGLIDEDNLRKVRVSISSLNMFLRQKGIFNINDVEFAVMETDGKLSVLPRSQKQAVTPADIGLGTGYKGLTRDIIIDGTILHNNLHDCQLDESWLTETLRERGINDSEQVFYAGLDTSGSLYVSPKSNQM